MLRGLEYACCSGRWWSPPSRRRASTANHGIAATVILLAHLAIAAVDPLAAAPKYAHEISSRLNPTGRKVTIPVPVEDQGHALGDVLIQIQPDDSIHVDKASLLERLAGSISEETRGAVAMLPDNGGFVAIERFGEAGAPLVFDHSLQQLRLDIAAGQRATADLNMRVLPPAMTENTALMRPEILAGYLNVIAGVDHLWTEPSSQQDNTSLRLDLEGALSYGGVVFENRFAYDGDVDPLDCPLNVLCTYSHAAGLKRQHSRLVYDLPEYQTRLTAGDTGGAAASMQRSVDILGLSVEKSARKLAPGEPMTSGGNGSFSLDRKASVHVIVNGIAVQTLHLRPGQYNLRDLPLATGANDVTLEITHDDGSTHALAFSAYADASLLAAGKSEWALGAGLPSYLIDNSRTYGADAFMASGFYRQGLTDSLTGNVHLQGDDTTLMGGLDITIGTNWGLFGLGGAASASDDGTGAAATFNWQLVNFSGFTGSRAESLYAEAEYRSTNFHTPGEYITAATGVLYPEFNYWLRLSASYSAPVYDEILGTLSARYMFANPDREQISANTVTADQYGADLTLAAPLSETTNASLTAGYSNELYLYDDATTHTADPAFRIAIRLNMRPDDQTSVSASYDTLGQQANLSANRYSGSGVGRWDTSISLDTRGADDIANLNASGGYYGNRGEIRIGHSASADHVDLTSVTSGDTRQRTSITAGTAIAFAGDKLAVGAPVRGNAFAILAPHRSLGDREVIAGNMDAVRAAADEWGNGLVSDIPAYMPSATTIDVPDLPIGYSLGSGAFETFAPYKGGYVFEVGSANSVSVYGTLVMPNGDPVALIAGFARPDSGGDKRIAVFTNAEGRFGAEGLAPGRWHIEMPLDNATLAYVVDVPETANGLIKVGTLAPIERTAE